MRTKAGWRVGSRRRCGGSWVGMFWRVVLLGSEGLGVFIGVSTDVGEGGGCMDACL